jgi:hypothetical protein
MAGKPDTNAVPATGVPSVMTGTQTTRATAQSKIIGYYYIKAENSKKCAEDPGWSKAKSRVLDQWSCLHQRNEWWDIESAGTWKRTKLVTIKNVYSGLCAAVSGGSRRNGTPVVQWKCSSDNSKWWITHVKSSGGYEWYNIHNLNTGKCLNVSGSSHTNGAHLIEYSCVNAADEHFTFPHTP